MAHLKYFLITAVIALVMSACGGQAKSDEAPTEVSPGTEVTTESAAHGTSAEYTSAYVCPMHCEGSGSDQAGTCPKCGMDYVAQADHTADGHAH